MLTVVWVHGAGWLERGPAERAAKMAVRRSALAQSLGPQVPFEMTLAGYLGIDLPGVGPSPLAASPTTATGSKPPSSRSTCDCCKSGQGWWRKRAQDAARTGNIYDLVAGRWKHDPEVQWYLSDPEWREQAVHRVAAQIPPDTDLMIGHSLGSAVALEVLARLPEGRRPRAFLTTGTPLRHEPFRKVATATGVAQWSGQDRTTPWINVYDKADLASKGTRLDEDNYGPLIQVEVNNATHGSGHHSGTAHLAHPAVGAQIISTLAEVAAEPPTDPNPGT